MKSYPNISFTNTKNAFAYKTDMQLKKTRFIFSLMQLNWLVSIATKVTPLMMKIGLPLNGVIKKTIFSQFCGGITLEDTAMVAETIGKYQVQTVLDYGIEGKDGEENYDAACVEMLRVINFAATQIHIPFVSIKLTGYARFSLMQKMDEQMKIADGNLYERFYKVVEKLSLSEKNEWDKVFFRVMKICSLAAEKKVGLFIDAEESWIQAPIDALCMQLMEKFNQQQVIVFNTFQHYIHDRLSFLKWSYQTSLEKKFILGAKLVRGAYMEKERKRAMDLGYTSPIHPDKESCDKDYNAGIEFCIQHIENVKLIVASHNEYSNLYAVEGLQKKGLPVNHPHVHWSQLYGMSDNITFNLAKAGCSVSKFLPFGPIKDVIPYLMRRAQENSSIGGQTGKELSYIKKELQRRGGD